MATYFWVALGSALGGMARYWMTLAVAAVTGTGFPWGTILINILGSFVIGFFATLTGPDGRLGVPFDARVFVLTGLCGGFTTFSAFSLQTLELARDGRWPQAAANVALSLTLCLAAVAAGHYVAQIANAAGRSPT
jgi:CrcB protein